MYYTEEHAYLPNCSSEIEWLIKHCSRVFTERFVLAVLSRNVLSSCVNVRFITVSTRCCHLFLSDTAKFCPLLVCLGSSCPSINVCPFKGTISLTVQVWTKIFLLLFQQFCATDVTAKELGFLWWHGFFFSLYPGRLQDCYSPLSFGCRGLFP